MRQKRIKPMLALALMFFVCACGVESHEPPIQAAAAKETKALAAQTMEESPVSTMDLSPSSSSSDYTPITEEESSLSAMAIPSLSSSVAGSVTVAVPEPYDESIAMKGPLMSYLEEPIPPCTPINSDGPDPCETELLPHAKESGSNSSYIALLPDVLPTISEVINELHPILTPHIVVRATGLPDTTRCDGLYPIRIANFEPEDRGLSNLFHYYCFTDFRINEYIIGEGPPILTIDIAAGAVSLADPDEVETVDEQWMKQTFDLPNPERSSKHEGKEYIIMLGVYENFSIEVLSPQGYYYSMWQIIRENDELRAISAAMEDWARTPEHRQQMNRPLDELIQEIKQAIENRATQTGGRIGMDPSLPLLITDANDLQDFYQTVGAVYEGDDATVLPPPVPGQEDPEQDPTQTGENQPTTSTIPAPGEEETTPPPTDDATTTTTSTTQPQTDDTTTTTSPTGATQPETQDTIPTPTATTQPPANNDNTIPAAETTEPSQADRTGPE